MCVPTFSAASTVSLNQGMREQINKGEGVPGGQSMQKAAMNGGFALKLHAVQIKLSFELCIMSTAGFVPCLLHCIACK